jgi:outer membrane protein OmpA-like peptidoglycan-associated protein
LRLSERRAAAVKAALLKAGIEESRVDFGFYGDKEQPYENPSQKRVVICTLE